MPAPLVPIAVIAGFGLITSLISLLNERRPVDVGGLFPVEGRNDWPQGVQEPDVPRFAVEHAEVLRPADPVGEQGEDPWIQELEAPLPPMPPLERI